MHSMRDPDVSLRNAAVKRKKNTMQDPPSDTTRCVKCRDIRQAVYLKGGSQPWFRPHPPYPKWTLRLHHLEAHQPHPQRQQGRVVRLERAQAPHHAQNQKHTRRLSRPKPVCTTPSSLVKYPGDILLTLTSAFVNDVLALDYSLIVDPMWLCYLGRVWGNRRPQVRKQVQRVKEEGARG